MPSPVLLYLLGYIPWLWIYKFMLMLSSEIVTKTDLP